MYTPKNRNRDRTRLHILTSAKNLVSLKGIAALTVNSLAQEANIGKPLIYRYYQNIEGVRSALLKDALSAARKEMEKTPPLGLQVSEPIYRCLCFGRLLSGNRLLRELMRCLLAGQLVAQERSALLALVPKVNAKDQAPWSFLLAGMSFLVLLKEFSPSFSGVGLENTRDLAKLEEVFVRMASYSDR